MTSYVTPLHGVIFPIHTFLDTTYRETAHKKAVKPFVLSAILAFLPPI